MSAEEERMLKLAIKNSLLEKKQSMVSPQLAPSTDETHESVLT
jgi:hypothetical protein